MLRIGQTVTALPDRRVEVADELGAGGQGTVYRVRTEVGDKALKWYFPSGATREQRQIVKRLVEMGQPDVRFLWPEAVVVGQGDDQGFGYLMDLRPARFVGLPALFKRRVKTTLMALVTASIHTVEAYRTLHARGIAYRDISWGNVFLDPAAGDVLVCDNDNAVFEGQDTGIQGTVIFMAPELVRGDPGARPSTQTDLHALAVLLFMILMNHHPLEGANELQYHSMDFKAQRALYGRRPLFIYDPDDDSNRPVRGEHDAVITLWRVTPEPLRQLFTKAFTVGLHEPNERVREWEWLERLGEVRDSIAACAACGGQNYVDVTALRASGYTGTCWRCQRPLVLPAKLELTGGRMIMLNRGAVLYPHHLSRESAYDFTTVVAEVTEHPARPGRYGVTNRSKAAWTATSPGGTERTIGPGDTAPLRIGSVLSFPGGVRGKIMT